MTSSAPISQSLAPTIWFDRIRLLDARLDSGRMPLENALRHAFHLLQLAPGPLGDMFGITTGEEQFEEWLDTGAWNEAARALVADHLPITIDKPDGHATVKVEGLWFDAACERREPDPATAVLRAWLGCILDVQEKASGQLFTHPDPGRQGSRYGPRRPLKPH